MSQAHQPGWVLLDRDGVINRDSSAYIRSAQEWQPLPGALRAIARLTAAGYRIAVVTNQSGIARGYFSRATLAGIHEKLFAAVRATGGCIEAAFFCPHGPDDHCGCRKPAPGLLLAAMRFLRADPKHTLMIGDSPRDLEAARGAGIKALLIAGAGQAVVPGVAVCPDLAAAVDRLLANAP